MSRAVVVGLDAALVSASLGFMYALVTSSPVGKQALPMAMWGTLVGFIVGVAAMAGFWRGPRLMTTPNATGVLVLAAMLFELQTLPGMQGSVAAAVLAVSGTCLVYGLLQVLYGHAGVGAAMKFLPFPVISGFTNTVALSLVVSMLPSALGHDYLGRLLKAPTWFTDVRPGALVVAAAGLLAGLAVRRRWPLAPAAIVALGAGTGLHHAWLALAGPSALGPTLALGQSVLPDWPSAHDLLANAANLRFWGLVLKTALVMSVLNSLFSLLTAVGLMRPDDPPLDANALLRVLGWGNMASALSMGLPLAVVAPTSIVMRREPVRWRPTLAVYMLAVLAVFLGLHDALKLLPLAAVAAAVFTAAATMFDVWSVGTLRRLGRQRQWEARAGANLLVSVSVTTVGLLFGLASALFVGTLAAVLLLAIEMRRSVVMASSDGHQRRSRHVRGPAEAAVLDAHGTQVRIMELGHWLYFGTVDELTNALDKLGTDVRWLILDLHRVAGVDATAARAMWMASQRLANRGVRLVIAGLPAGDARRASFDLFSQGGAPLHLMPDLDQALEQAEDALLAAHPLPATAGQASGLNLPGLSDSERQALQARMQRLPTAVGQTLFRQGEPGQALYVVLQGRVTLRVRQGPQASLRLLTFGPGLMFGEMAMLDGRDRSTDAVVDVAGEVAVFTQADLQQLALDAPDLHAAVLRGIALHLAARLRETTRLLQERG